jgi:hypothetical protein
MGSSSYWYEIKNSAAKANGMKSCNGRYCPSAVKLDRQLTKKRFDLG